MLNAILCVNTWSATIYATRVTQGGDEEELHVQGLRLTSLGINGHILVKVEGPLPQPERTQHTPDRHTEMQEGEVHSRYVVQTRATSLGSLRL